MRLKGRRSRLRAQLSTGVAQSLSRPGPTADPGDHGPPDRPSTGPAYANDLENNQTLRETWHSVTHLPLAEASERHERTLRFDTEIDRPDVCQATV